MLKLKIQYFGHLLRRTDSLKKTNTIRLQKTGMAVVESLNYEDLTGTVEISGNVKKARLYSPDLDEVKDIQTANGKAVIDLNGLQRFFSVIVEK